ncbi:hypothetical protein [Priestia megaterium]|nr:hypothetical protein [Priestia megaterium]MDH2364059.1 hypothetical protein [Priestia megaterium]
MRVSTNEQNLDRQFEAIQPYITNEKYLYSGKAIKDYIETRRFSKYA